MKRSDNLVWYVMGSLSLILILGIIGLSITGFITFNPSGEIVPDVNTVGLWHLNGDALDEVSGVIGTLVGGVSCSASGGKINGACSFDGTDDTINLRDISGADSVDALSVSAWVQNDLSGVASSIVTKSHSAVKSWSLTKGSNDKFSFRVFNDLDVSQTVSTSGQYNGVGWYHVVATYDGAELKIYVDDGTPSIAAFTGNIKDTSRNVCIGGTDNTAGCLTGDFDGSIDEVTIWNKALTLSEVQELFEAGGGTPPLCVEDWSCVGYAACVNNLENCNSVVDGNTCGTTYTGDFSEFAQSCVESCTDGANRPCGSDVGLCTIGTETCSGGTWGACSGVSPCSTLPPNPLYLPDPKPVFFMPSSIRPPSFMMQSVACFTNWSKEEVV